MISQLKLGQFRYKLPPELIAQYPAKYRDESRMMVIHRKSGKVEHKMFKDIARYFDEGDIMIANDTRVFPARLYANKERTGSMIEVFMLRELNAETLLWDTVVDPARKIRIGNKLYFGETGDELIAEVIDNTTSRGRTLRFLYDGTHEEFKKIVYQLGETPLPKYIKRKVEPEDEFRYQTIFAKHEGAVAAPTAGLHFSREMIKRLELRGVVFGELTQHIGLGTYRTVEVEDLTKHKMDSEQVIISAATADLVNEARTYGRRICAIGTTVLRAMESSMSTGKMLKPIDGWTSKFIYPPYEFSIADSLLTNFHNPESVLLMMTAAFGGHELIMEAYQIAIKEKYRFWAYGDAMLII